MAYRNDRKLIARTRQSARALGVAATWVTSRQPVQVSNDFLFEMYVLFELVFDLLRSYRISYLPGGGNKVHQFPRKPADKIDRPRFEVYDKRRRAQPLWQICAGTKILDKVGMKRAPDISLQQGGAPDDPNYAHVEMIWDAKYRTKKTARITHAELAEFGRWIDLMELLNASSLPINLSTLAEMVANCLVTNARESTEPDLERTRLRLKEVFNFFPDENFTVRP